LADEARHSPSPCLLLRENGKLLVSLLQSGFGLPAPVDLLLKRACETMILQVGFDAYKNFLLLKGLSDVVDTPGAKPFNRNRSHPGRVLKTRGIGPEVVVVIL